jgi:hypothetical protein
MFALPAMPSSPLVPAQAGTQVPHGNSRRGTILDSRVRGNERWRDPDTHKIHPPQTIALNGS